MGQVEITWDSDGHLVISLLLGERPSASEATGQAELFGQISERLQNFSEDHRR